MTDYKSKYLKYKPPLNDNKSSCSIKNHFHKLC